MSNTPPLAQLSIAVLGTLLDPTQFSTLANDPDGRVVVSRMQWGDDSDDSVWSGPPPATVEHAYPVGTFTATLILEDNKRALSTAAALVTIPLPAPLTIEPIADIAVTVPWNATTGEVPLPTPVVAGGLGPYRLTFSDTENPGGPAIDGGSAELPLGPHLLTVVVESRDGQLAHREFPVIVQAIDELFLDFVNVPETAVLVTLPFGVAAGTATYPAVSAAGGQPPIDVGFDPPVDHLFEIGEHTVTVTATSIDGQVKALTFPVVVRSATSSLVLLGSVPDRIEAQLDADDDAIEVGYPTLTATGGQNPVIVFDPPVRTAFGVGEHPVHITVTSDDGQHVEATFTVAIAAAPYVPPVPVDPPSLIAGAYYGFSITEAAPNGSVALAAPIPDGSDVIVIVMQKNAADRDYAITDDVPGAPNRYIKIAEQKNGPQVSIFRAAKVTGLATGRVIKGAKTPAGSLSGLNTSVRLFAMTHATVGLASGANEASPGLVGAHQMSVVELNTLPGRAVLLLGASVLNADAASLTKGATMTQLGSSQVRFITQYKASQAALTGEHAPFTAGGTSQRIATSAVVAFHPPLPGELDDDVDVDTPPSDPGTPDPPAGSALKVTQPTPSPVYVQIGQSAAVAYGNPVITGGQAPYGTPVFDPPAGTLFGIGLHPVTVTVTDNAGASASTTFTASVSELVILPPSSSQRNAIYEELAAHPKCSRAYSMRSDAQINQFVFGRGQYKNARVSYDPNIDAAHWHWDATPPAGSNPNAEQLRFPCDLQRPAIGSGVSEKSITFRSEHFWDDTWMESKGNWLEPKNGGLARLDGWKWLQVTDNVTGNQSIWSEQNTTQIGRNGVLSMFSNRGYNSVQAPTVKGGPLVNVEGHNYGSDAIGPMIGTFRAMPFTWFATVYRVRQIAGDAYAHLDWWMLDENQEAVQIIKDAKMISGGRNALHYCSEFNTSRPIRIGGELNAWISNQVQMWDLSDSEVQSLLLRKPKA